MTSACSEFVMIWEMEPEFKLLLKVDVTQDIEEDEEAEGGSDLEAPPPPTLACLDDECT